MRRFKHKEERRQQHLNNRWWFSTLSKNHHPNAAATPMLSFRLSPTISRCVSTLLRSSFTCCSSPFDERTPFISSSSAGGDNQDNKNNYDSDNDNDDNLQQHHHQQRPHLWLDLRGIALSPNEAMDHLRELLEIEDYTTNRNKNNNDYDDDFETNKLPSDTNHERVLPLSSSTSVLSWIDHVVVSPEEIFHSTNSESTGHKLNDVWYVTNDHHDKSHELLVRSHNDMSFPIGKVISIKNDNHNKRKTGDDDDDLYWKLNPLLAMETVSQGEWYWMDCSATITSSSSWTPALTSLLDMVTLAASSDVTSLPRSTSSPLLGLFESYDPQDPDQQSLLPTTTATDIATQLIVPTSHLQQQEQQVIRNNRHDVGGGLAISCPTADALWVAASLLFAQSESPLHGHSHVLTKSGILIPPTISSAAEQTTTTTTTTTSSTTAIRKNVSLAFVLPFDAGLWKTAEKLLMVDEVLPS